MSLVAYTITALELNQADATASGKQVVVGASCSMFIQPADTVVLLYDDAAASNGSTAKTTGVNGQVTVYIQPGSYRVVANSISRFVQVGQDDAITTVGLISSTGIYPADTVINSSGYTASGDKGHGRWKQNGVTGLTPSQSPSQLGDLPLLNDGNGNQWAKIFADSYTANGNTFTPYYTPQYAGRVEERMFFGSAAKDAGGTTSFSDSTTFIAGFDFNSYYLERAAQNLSISKRGGIGTVSGSVGSARYTTLGYAIWQGTTAVLVGDKRGWGGRLYTATIAGTTSSTPPSHTSGTATDGTVTWQFDDYTYNVAIGEAACALADMDDGSGVWARYSEIVRLPAGGTSFAHEIVVKNKGNDVVNNPYNRFPQGATIGDMYAGGGDPSLGAPTAPSTCGALFIKNGQTWNKGIVFDKESITGTDGVTGYGIAIALAKGHLQSWFTPEGLIGAEVTSDVTQNAKRGLIIFGNNNVKYRAGGSVVFTASKLTDGSTGSILAESYGGNARLSAESTGTDADLLLSGKGAGFVRFGTHVALSGETVTGSILMKDESGTLRKVAILS
jgi:hypothetical protein